MSFTQPRPQRHIGLPWLTLALFALLSCGALAADDNTPPASAEAAARVAAPAAAPVDKPKQCYNGCQSWGQMCNVDPRGVYKCQRRCEKFGEICE